ncbi:hypothetical protein KR767_04200 [Luteibacter anthropi]|uniref:hypothetical protein n=1 Tax=Luteibacter anthropi TaxID=564369 RepID=UPI0020326FA8|nr:hypothetical protein [Luteibacter anthropi]URX63279.1 hypothetical protein KR767_04200 [Luteibacter anthropi]
MKAIFRVTDPRLLLEASPGELFTPLGPYLVECVCAIRSSMTDDGIQPDLAAPKRLSPDASIPVVVLACRMDPGEPEYYPAGFEMLLPAASPIVFLAMTAPVALEAKEPRGLPDAPSISVASPVITSPLANAITASVHLARPELATRL